MRLADVVKHLSRIFERKRKNPILLGKDSNLESNLKNVKIGNESTIVDISETELKIRGTINADAINVNGSAVQTGTDAGATELNELSDVSYSSNKLEVSGMNELVVGEASFDIDCAGSITLDAHTGVFIAKKAGVEFSPTNSAYSGMILGYTCIGLNETHATLNLTTSYVVPTDEFSVSFTAPPSGNVEIQVQIQHHFGLSGLGDLAAGLSTANATSGYSALASHHEFIVNDGQGRNAVDTVQISWTLTGLTAGTDYEYWVGFKAASTTGTPKILWGGSSADRYADFIMKATALPATITT
mgnify:CR=1 FL=1|tara:strand:- start:3127 stop:4026 length:900 start_codon:yes stop_codon:yes gene_type:complete